MLLPLHSFAVQGGWLSAGQAYDLAHEFEHLEGASHHHGDDGTVHYDDSGESAKHFSEHSASQPAFGLPTMSLPPLSFESLTVPSSRLTQYIPDPIPERPQRPPSTLG
jgi:hypothetical protein